MQRAFLLIAKIGLLCIPPHCFTLPFTNVECAARCPSRRFFGCKRNQAALNFNLAESRNSIVQVGSYTLVSIMRFLNFAWQSVRVNLAIRTNSVFVLDQNEPLLPGQLSVIPFTVRVNSNISRAVSVSGSQAMQKDLGVRGVYGNNEAILYESGDILAEIPDFDPDLYATGWYSAAIQLSIEVL